MAGLNLTGQANTADYNLGRGILYLATLSNGLPDVNGWRDLGNCPEFNASVEVETLDHQSSRQGLRVTDKSVVVSQTVNLSFQLDEVNFQNLALFFSGAASQNALVNPAVAGVTNVALTSAVKLGRWYDLKDANGVRIYDITPGNLSVREDVDGTPATLVQGTDYTVDAKMGRIFFLTTGGATEGEDVDFSLTADAGAVAPDEVKALTQTNVIAALKFISENPADNDRKTEYVFHQVQLRADGDFPLIGDEFTQMGFTAVAESNVLADPDSPICTIRTHANA